MAFEGTSVGSMLALIGTPHEADEKTYVRLEVPHRHALLMTHRALEEPMHIHVARAAHTLAAGAAWP
jgi:hypothetical protein